MAFIKLYRDKLKHNYNYLDKTFNKNGIEWGVVSKLLCGTRAYLEELINLGIKEIHDSRISNLKRIKEIDSKVQTVYIKPPAKRSIKSVIRYADVSFNTEFTTIKLLSDEAVRMNRHHKIIIMIEMGDLREGVMGENLLDFYEKVFELPNISIIGLGTNLNCLHGVLPSQDKLIQLSLYKQIIEAKFNKKIRWVSGGTSVTLPLLFTKQLPKGINHFRLGETLYFGNDLIKEKPIKGMKQDVIMLYTEIIELTEKPANPIGPLGVNPSGETAEVDPELYGKTNERAILDIGLLDIDPKFLMPVDEKLEIAGASSDMIVVNLDESKKKYKVGDLVPFKLKYMGALGLMNSNYVDKVVE